MTAFFRLLPVLALWFLTACEQPAESTLPIVNDTKQITGSVTYRERIALTRDAELEVSLRDVSIADAPAPLIAQMKIPDPGQVPIRFELPYSSDQIDQRRVYAIQARITDRGRLMFINDTHTPVLTRGADDEVNMTLISVPERPPVVETGSNEGPGFEIEGMFRYMADAALFRDCRDNRVYPVAMEGQYIEVERAYLNSGIEGGEEAFVRLTGRYLERPPMEGNTNKVKLIIDTFKQLSLEKSCAPEVHATLQDTYWKLLEIEGQPIVTREGTREIHVILASADSRAHGFAGCNNFFGQYQAEGEVLTFSPLGSTMMACPEGMDREQAFLQLLSATTRAEISGQIMSLYENDRLLARFEAVYL